MTDIIANILLREIGSTPKVQPVTPSTGLGAMTSRKGITAPQEEQQADPTQNIQRPIIDIYRKIVQQEIGDGSGLTGDKIPYDPLVDTPETLAARGYNPDEVLRNSVFSSTISGTKGRTPKDKVLTDIEDLIQSYEDKRLAKKRSVSKERATASSSILDVLQAELMRGMTSKQTDTQPTVSADSSRDRFELQGDMRDLPVLDDEDAPEVDTRSNELLDKPPVDAPDAETPMPAPSEVKEEGLMSDPRGFKVPEYKVYNSPEEMSELEILARTIEAEAALEPYNGKIAVGATIANRAASGSYGKDIRGVILKPAQFSPWNKYTGAAKGKQGKNMMKLRASEDSYKAANDILTGNYDDPTNGATHYVNESIAEGQKWIDVMKGRKKGTVTIGNHLFGNADNNKKYDGKSYIFDRKSETTDQPVEAAPITVKAIQRIIGTVADGDFGPASRKKAREFLNSKGIDVTKSATDEDLMKLVVSS